MKWKQLALATAILTSINLSFCKKDNKNDNDNNPVNNSGSNVNDTDRDFMAKTAMYNNAIMRTANIAMAKTSNIIVKSYTQDMLSKYETAQNDLINVGTSVGYLIADSVDATHEDLIQQLNELEGNKFDSVYMHNQVKDHQNALANFQSGEDNGQNTSVKGYVSTYYPATELNLARADSITNALFK